MVYSEFINKTSRYLKSVRILKNYVSLDMIFPSTWVMLKKMPDGIEIVQTETQDSGMVSSFVCENKEDLLNKVEEVFNNIVKTNIEREEKERLFKTKVQELKSIFETKNLETSLKNNSLKYSSLFENQNEKYKKELSEQIKKYKNTQLINTPIVEEKYNLWQRILKTLGMN